MSLKTDIISRLSGEVEGEPFYLPDLTLWHEWHSEQGTLPDKWSDYTLPQIARDMGVPIWLPVTPWRVETPGVEVTETQTEDERVYRVETSAGVITARWTLGPDGDWWQMEHLIKSPADFNAALEFVNAQSYAIEYKELTEAEAQVGGDGIVALELPMRPYSAILHNFLGWAEGLLMLKEPAIAEIISILDAKLQNLVQEIAKLPGRVVLSPDNLDGQYISPKAFDKNLAGSYRLTAELLHKNNKLLVVHVGGPFKRLLAPLAEAGADCIEGIAGPPQGDAALSEARELAGADITLWGGISQDFLIAERTEEEFKDAVSAAVEEVQDDKRAIIGVADRVPVDAELDRLEVLSTLIA